MSEQTDLEILKHAMQLVRGGGSLDLTTAMQLATSVLPDTLFEAADQLRREFHNDNLDLCSILNAKSGKCSEDCKFCAQSSRYSASIDTYEMIDEQVALQVAKENEVHNVRRISLVTAGRSVSMEQLEILGALYGRLRQETGLSLCASMGMLTFEKAQRLKSFGVTRYHCNLEACREYFPQVCTTHSYQEKVDSIKAAQQAGLEVCSGGIIGMGESLRHRLELAMELRDLGVLSIPINILTPIPSTPFGELQPLSLGEILTSVAMFRFINPQAVIRLAGGRALLGDQQGRCFTAGANGAIVGNYLTTVGNNLGQDLEMFTALGFHLQDSEEQA